MIDPKSTTTIVRAHSEYLKHNADLMQIYEGDLLPFVDKALQDQLSHQSYLQAKQRIMPINVLPKVVDKLTNIYQTTVMREVIDGSESDNELVEWYVDNMCLNEVMNCGNELYNLCKGALLYPSVYRSKPYLRTIQNDRFIVVGQNENNPQMPTDVIILAGKKDGDDLYWVFDENSFVVYRNEEIDRAEMARLGNPEGVNPYGALPYVWVNDSKYKIMPVQDSSVMKVVVSLPVILSDLNLAAMFQTFSIIYGIDLDDENIKFAPNAFWKLKSDLANDKKPEIGQIKPQVDIDQVIRLIEAELSMWLGSKGIRPGSIGSLTPENITSGISKIIDEMDTYESRQKQVVVFQKAEEKLWDLIINHMHPYWVATGLIENRGQFTSGVKVKVSFATQLPQQARGEVVRDLKDEVAAGFTTRAIAIQKLNPEMSQEEVEDLLKEIEEPYESTGPGSDNPSPENPEGPDAEPAQGAGGFSN